MPTTTRGYDYPAGSAKFAEANLHIKALADSVDARAGRTIHGTAALPSGTGPVNVVVTIPGGALPSTAYSVCANANSGNITRVLTHTKTTTQFTITAERTVAGSYTADWILHY